MYSRNDIALQNSRHIIVPVWTCPGSLCCCILKNEQESICFQWFFDRNGTTIPSKLSIMTWTVLTSSLLPLLTKLSLHTPLRLASRLTDTSAARITASKSRETRQPGCVSASPRLKSLHKCDLYWLIYETACRLPSFCARSCACCRAGVSNTNLLLVAWQTEGSSGSGPARRQSFCPSIQLSPPPPPPKCI